MSKLSFSIPTTPASADAFSEHPLYLGLSAIRVRESKGRARDATNATIRLTESIRKYGILQPLTVRFTQDAAGTPCYELVDGKRRYRAAVLLGLEKLPCVVLQTDDPACAKQAVVDRLRQEKPHFFDIAAAFQTLVNDYKMTQEEIATHMGLSQSAVANKLRLLQLSAEEQHFVRSAGLTERHTRALLRVKDASDRRALLASVAQKSLNVSETERLIEEHLQAKVEAARPQNAPVPPLQESADATSNRSLAPTVFYFSRETPAKLSPKTAATRGGEASAHESFGEESEQGRAVHPNKFALRDLRPLYNSIDRTLAIFRKTGNDVECSRREDEAGVDIHIRIPK